MLGDNHVLYDINQSPGEVAGVCRLQSRICKALAGAVGGGEVLQDRKAFAEGCRNRRFNDFAVRLGHKAAHTGQLAHLFLVASGA